MARLLPLISIFLVTLMYQHQPAEGIAFLTVVKAGQYAHKVYKYCNTIAKYLRVPGEEVDTVSKVDAKILGKLDDIAGDVQSLRAHLDDKLSKLPTKLSVKTSELLKEINDIHSQYKSFLDYVRNYDKYEAYTLKEFADSVTSGRIAQMKRITESIHELFAGSDLRDLGENNILSLLVESSPSEQICSVGQSLQQLILNLYQTIVLTEMEGLAATHFSYSYLGKTNATKNREEPFAFEKQSAVDKLKERVNSTYLITKNFISALNDQSREFYKCDPKYQIEDKTYSKMQDIFQDYIINEADMKGYKDCENHCEELTNMEEDCKTDFCRENKKKCTGRNRRCKKVFDQYTLCLADENSNRRYEWINTSNNTVLGQSRKKSSCKNPKPLKAKDIHPLGWKHVCQYCMCTCEADGDEMVRFISMREVRSDTENGKVITGVRLHKENNTFYIQIQEGQIQPNGTINATTVDWTPIKPEAEYADVRSPHQYDFKVDYYSKTVLLDDVKAPSNNRVLTGLRFRYGDQSALRLEIETTEFDYIKGIFIGNGEWQYNDTLIADRDEVDLENSDDPLKAKKNEEFSRPGQLVKFQQTDRVKDLGQNTIPFIDMQNVTLARPIPLMGAGLYHKGSGKTGGFLGLKVFTFDYAPYFE